MAKNMAIEVLHHGWLVQVTRERTGYAFRCEASELRATVIGDRHYSTCLAALQAGKLRADLESVRLSLTTFIHGKLQRLLLSPEERIALEDSIAQFVEVASHSISS